MFSAPLCKATPFKCDADLKSQLEKISSACASDDKSTQTQTSGSSLSWQGEEVSSTWTSDTEAMASQTSEGDIGSSVRWEATLWKRSKYLRIWRQRRMQLARVPDGWQLTSWSGKPRRSTLKCRDRCCTGKWTLEASLPYIPIRPRCGFAAAIDLPGGVALGSDTKEGTSMLNELCILLNGSFMRTGTSPFCQVLSADAPVAIVVDQLDEGAPPMCSMLRPYCERCVINPSQGQLVRYFRDCVEKRNWLCNGCRRTKLLQEAFVSASDDNGNCARSAAWLALLSNGVLVPTPMRMARS